MVWLWACARLGQNHFGQNLYFHLPLDHAPCLLDSVNNDSVIIPPQQRPRAFARDKRGKRWLRLRRAGSLPATSGRRKNCLLRNRNLNHNHLRGGSLRLRLGMLWDDSADKVTSVFPRGAAARRLRGAISRPLQEKTMECAPFSFTDRKFGTKLARHASYPPVTRKGEL